MSTQPNPVSDELRNLLEMVFRAGVGFERGESMMDYGHLKLGPSDALKRVEQAIDEAVADTRYEYSSIIYALERAYDHGNGIDQWQVQELLATLNQHNQENK